VLYSPSLVSPLPAPYLSSQVALRFHWSFRNISEVLLTWSTCFRFHSTNQSTPVSQSLSGPHFFLDSETFYLTLPCPWLISVSLSFGFANFSGPGVSLYICPARIDQNYLSKKLPSEVIHVDWQSNRQLFLASLPPTQQGHLGGVHMKPALLVWIFPYNPSSPNYLCVTMLKTFLLQLREREELVFIASWQD
jgi:hypothetical protein